MSIKAKEYYRCFLSGKFEIYETTHPVVASRDGVHLPHVIVRRNDEAISLRSIQVSMVLRCNEEIINVVNCFFKVLMSSLRSVVHAALAMTWF